MKMRKSLLHGRLENEVDNFIAALENEHGLDVQSVSISYVEECYGESEKYVHVFHVCEKDTSSFEI